MKKIVSVLILLALLSAAVPTAQASNEAIMDARRGVVRIYTEIDAYSYSIGTAFVISHVEDMTVLVTNRHCVEDNPDEVYIVTSDIYGRMIKAEVYYLSSDANLDLAILVTERLDGYKELPLAASETVFVTTEVYTLGFPAMADDIADGGWNRPSTINNMTVTRGIISNSKVSIQGYDFFQTDATITGGNSGGPLLNADGAVIGVNTLKHSGSEGYNYALYIDYIIDFMQREGLPYIGYTPGSAPPPATPPPVDPQPEPPPLQPPPADSPIIGSTWELFEMTDGVTTVDRSDLIAAGAWATLQFFEDGSCLLTENISHGLIEYSGMYGISGNSLTINIEFGTMTGTVSGDTLTLQTLGQEVWTFHISQQSAPEDPDAPAAVESLAGTTWELYEMYDGTATYDKETLDAGDLWMTVSFFENGTVVSNEVGETVRGTYVLSGMNLTITSDSGLITTGTVNSNVLTLYVSASGAMLLLRPLQEPITAEPSPPPTPAPTPPPESPSPSPQPSSPDPPVSSPPSSTDGQDDWWILIVVLAAGGLAVLLVCLVIMHKNRQQAQNPPSLAPGPPPGHPLGSPPVPPPGAPPVPPPGSPPGRPVTPLADPRPAMSHNPPPGYAHAQQRQPSPPPSAYPIRAGEQPPASPPASRPAPMTPQAPMAPAAYPASNSAASQADRPDSRLAAPPQTTPPASPKASPQSSSAPLPVVIKPISSPDPGKQAHLYCTRGEFTGKYFPIEGKVYIGRDPQHCHLLFPGHVSGISRLHCSVQQSESGLVLTDMKSMGGTHLSGGRKLDAYESVTLIPGDCFYLADAENEFMVF